MQKNQMLKLVIDNTAPSRALGESGLPILKVRYFLQQYAVRYGVRISGRHTEILARHSYRHEREVRRAVLRYKVFKDLGYGG